MMNVLTRSILLFAAMAVAMLLALPPSSAPAVTPQSPEVRALVEKGLAYLSENTDERLGGKCIIALSYLKDLDKHPKDHPRIKEALNACVQGARNSDPHRLDMYSNGLAIIFLCELNPRAHSDLIRHYLGMLKRRQKDHGGWGYEDRPTGDTSQSQYAALSYWEAHMNGFGIEGSSAAGLADWLVKTQDPTGAWGYQGKVRGSEGPVEQDGITCSMVAAAMGSALIAADLFGQLDSGAAEDLAPQRSAALRKKGEREKKRAPSLRSERFKKRPLFDAIGAGNTWMDKNYREDIGRYNIYYLYSLERYKSFQEKLDGVEIDEPDWYNKGYEFLKANQAANGSWSSGCQPGPDTAFAILFLVRSTQQIIDRSRGGLREGGRLPPPSSMVSQDSRGRLVIEKQRQALDSFLSMDPEQAAALDELAGDPNAFVLEGEVDEAAAQRLRQIVRGGSPGARRIAVRALSRTGDLDHVPTLLFAMTDPDAEVVRQARDGLRFISRRFEGFGLKDVFTEKERYSAREKWKAWYLSIRPDAIISVN